jgi:hypothetical protein
MILSPALVEGDIQMSGEFFSDRVIQLKVEGCCVTLKTHFVKILFSNRPLIHHEQIQLGLARVFIFVLFDCRFDYVLHETLCKIFRKLIISSEVLHMEVDD